MANRVDQTLMNSTLVTGRWFGTNHLVRGLCDRDLRTYEIFGTTEIGAISLVGKGSNPHSFRT